MPEINDVRKEEPGEKFGSVRKLYEPRRKDAQTLLKESGLEINTPEFRKARAKVARRFLEKDVESQTDELTGLMNLKGFNCKFDEIVKNAKKYGRETMLIILDANNLKEINDTKGHESGDDLLKGIAKILKENSRTVDCVARCGGDEFRVLLTETESEGARKWWERINPVLKSRGISIAAGATRVNLEKPRDAIDLADNALYRAKSYCKKNGNGTNHYIELRLD